MKMEAWIKRPTTYKIELYIDKGISGRNYAKIECFTTSQLFKIT